MGKYSGKKVYVTGASRGIGKSIAQCFYSEGAHVIGTYKNSEVGSENFCSEWFQSDFESITNVQECADHIRNIQPDILINNAGINVNAPFLEVELNNFQKIHQVNLVAPFLLCQAALPSMLSKGWGRIVNISSIWGKVSMSGRAAYSASKFALDGLTLSLSAEFARRGIVANCISPGFIDTDLTRQNLGQIGIRDLVARVPASRLAMPEEIAKLVLWLCSDENTFVMGQNISIDGGFDRA